MLDQRDYMINERRWRRIDAPLSRSLRYWIDAPWPRPLWYFFRQSSGHAVTCPVSKDLQTTCTWLGGCLQSGSN